MNLIERIKDEVAVRYSKTAYGRPHYTYSKEVSLPGGEFTLSLHSSGVGQESQFQINWFELSAATPVEYLQKKRDTGIFLYPNPCNQELHISSASAIEMIRVMDGGGRVVLEFQGKGKSVTIRTGMLVSGIYFVRVKSLDGIRYLKFIKS